MPAASRPSPHAARAARRHGKASPLDRVRLRHRKDVLYCLRDNGPLSRVELSQRLGQSTTTMAKVIAELIAQRWVSEGESRSGQTGAGRPRTALHLEEGGCDVVLLVVAPTGIQSARVGMDLKPHDILSEDFPVAERPSDDTLRTVTRHLDRRIGAWLDQGCALAGMAVVAPGTPDPQRRMSRFAPMLSWNRVDVVGPLEKALGLPAWLHNNTRSMALAEFRHLRLDADQPMLFVQAHYGLGAALVDSDHPRGPGHHGVSDLGQIPIGSNGFARRVPTDSLLCSVLQEDYLRRVLGADAAACGGIVAVLEEASRAGHRTARALYAQTVSNMALALGIAVNMLHMSVVVLGGIYALASPAFIADVRAGLGRHAHPDLLEGLRIQTAQLPALTGALQGGAMAAFDRIFDTLEPFTFTGAEA